jgi:hypothetical protein
MRREYNYSREHDIVEDLSQYSKMLKYAKAGTAEYNDISSHIKKLKNIKELNKKIKKGDLAYFSKGLPYQKGRATKPIKSDKQKNLDELYTEKREIEIKLSDIKERIIIVKNS